MIDDNRNQDMIDEDERGKVPPHACGWFWQTDYGPAYCDQGKGHETDHRCWGSNGAITSPVKPMHPEDQRTYRAIAESMALDAFSKDEADD